MRHFKMIPFNLCYLASFRLSIAICMDTW